MNSKKQLQIILIWFLVVSFISSHAQSTLTEMQVTITSEGWNLIGDLTLPDSEGSFPAVLMLNKAAGDRNIYQNLALHLANRGIASLRLDLRGHGESTNLGKFKPGEVSQDPIIWDAEKDVVSATDYLKTHELINSNRLAALGGSYSGEEMAEAGRLNGYLDAYVTLSPGSFSQESITGIDSSKVPWLFIVSKNERYLKEITQSVQDNSQSVELIIVPGAKHASDILNSKRELAERIAIWFTAQLQAE